MTTAVTMAAIDDDDSCNDGCNRRRRYICRWLPNRLLPISESQLSPTIAQKPRHQARREPRATTDGSHEPGATSHYIGHQPLAPAIEPSLALSIEPSLAPSIASSLAPSIEPSRASSIAPSIEPSIAPSIEPSIEPSLTPAIEPSGTTGATSHYRREPRATISDTSRDGRWERGREPSHHQAPTSHYIDHLASDDRSHMTRATTSATA
eukprot:CAMPEP_0172327644 /NCGR_PEP_ID=MMETSP1058-20130122/59938_1 /TAXON_ID=83371 /ORGANISM="Detonula confervacea, Strain CCMP 353" /LENGTH=207 /DNA_ID=CAMNT_0013044725 /DNA_START=1080 /DNA_END=1703 /DNA_ORIENTATION=-